MVDVVYAAHCAASLLRKTVAASGSLAQQCERLQREAWIRHIELYLCRHGTRRRVEISRACWNSVSSYVSVDSHYVVYASADRRTALRDRVLPCRAGARRACVGAIAHALRLCVSKLIEIGVRIDSGSHGSRIV